jgi:hypothetical protein
MGKNKVVEDGKPHTPFYYGRKYLEKLLISTFDLLFKLI